MNAPSVEDVRKQG
jgi:hypothetical protein